MAGGVGVGLGAEAVGAVHHLMGHASAAMLQSAMQPRVPAAGLKRRWAGRPTASSLPALPDSSGAPEVSSSVLSPPPSGFSPAHFYAPEPAPENAHLWDLDLHARPVLQQPQQHVQLAQHMQHTQQNPAPVHPLLQHVNSLGNVEASSPLAGSLSEGKNSGPRSRTSESLSARPVSL